MNDAALLAPNHAQCEDNVPFLIASPGISWEGWFRS